MSTQATGVNFPFKVGQLVKLIISADYELVGDEMTDHSAFKVYSSRLQDILADDLVISWPTEKGVQIPINIGEAVGLMGSTERGMMRLDSRIVGKAISPVPVLYIAKAGDWSRSQLRNNVRLQVTIIPYEVRLVWRHEPGRDVDNVEIDAFGLERYSEIDGEPITAVIRDISASGVRLASVRCLEPKDIVYLRFPLANIRRDITAYAEVVWTDEESSSTKYRHKSGCKFIGLSAKDQDNITKFIFAKQIELRQRGLL